ncbi:hypothetical protein P152DRAFT_148182 [Eremomyces bilateralis CBS 781.70]|uniref:FAR1 domain-containing protein n=1 Tax=Eremomyces bilateralis CBS 781.70 TaxID=1392243 RepID=A0A6G1FVQ0_9PEZI|nr:uncharacterized protein P152DRAFT_148182 [Eremomyces bilateralis CBS 781.70]KAF1809762.1 hypothetical protein P152DRAFT_148182 [Eremomyces bilateralis CBS 781.70]
MQDFWLALLTLIYLVNQQEKTIRTTHVLPEFDEDAFELEMLAYLEESQTRRQTATRQARQAVGLTFNLFPATDTQFPDPPINPTGGFETLGAAEEYIRRYARDRWFGISRQRSNVDKRNVVRKVFVQCNRAGTCFSKAQRRKSASRKSNCPWKVIIKRVDAGSSLVTA